MPLVTVAPNDLLLEKLKGNMMEVRARGGELFAFADAGTHVEASEGGQAIRPPGRYEDLSPLAYKAAAARGTCVDRPADLASGIAVERATPVPRFSFRRFPTICVGRDHPTD